MSKPPTCRRATEFSTRQNKNYQPRPGFSSLEMVIAFALLSLSLTAVVVTTFGSESMVADAQSNNEAMQKARAMLESARAFAREDFALVQPISLMSDGQHQKSLAVESGDDPFVKKITSTVSWQTDLRPQSVQLATIVSNPQAVDGGDMCGEFTGSWNEPEISVPIDVSTGVVGNPVTDVVAFNKKLYITTGNASGHNHDFYIYDLSVDPKNPAVLGSLDANGVTPGLNAVAVSRLTTGTYAYIANANDANFKTCSSGRSCSQFQVVDLSNPAAPTVRVNYKLPATTAPYVLGNITGRNGQAVGKNLFYRRGYLYLGLSTTANGPGFHIIDVHDPLQPFWVGSWPASSPTFGSSGAPINAISVQGNYAYLAHPLNLNGAPTEQLTVLDVSDPINPVRVGSFYDSRRGIGGNGKSVTLLGQKLYFGRTATNISGLRDQFPEFYVLDNSDPAMMPGAPLASLALDTAESVYRIAVRGNFAFLATNHYLQIHDITDSSNIALVKSIYLSDVVHRDANATALDCEGNQLYVGAYTTSDNKGIILPMAPGGS